jgi:hypothetical protein
MESNSVNVKDLPVIEEIVNGNYFIVEDEQGSKILDFKNFVVGPNNTSFYNAIVNSILSLSSYSTSLSTTVRNNTVQTVRAVDTRFNQLTAAFNVAFGNFDARYPKFLVVNGTLTVNPGASSSSTAFASNINTIDVSDVNVVCTTYDISGRNGFNVMPVAVGLSYVDAVVTTTDTFQDLPDSTTYYNYTLSLSTLKPLDPNSPAFVYRYSILKPYYTST